ncbi:hypothetical protein [Sulfurimonas marina]|nr:hypothetical protein [Sulfurimonas marina]
MRKTISLFLIAQGLILLTFLFSFEAFINVEVAFFSSFLIIIGSSLAYKNMVKKDIASGKYEEKRDLLDEIDDKYELYDDEPINDAPVEELDLKEIVKEEKAKIKTFSLSSMKYGTKGGFSLLRLVPYIFLVLGFIALKNNEILNLAFYLPALAFGIVIASLISKEMIAK